MPAPWWMPSSTVSRLQMSSRTGPREERAIRRKRGMIRRSKKTCMRKTFSSSRSSSSRNMRAKLVQIGVALGHAADLAEELQPRLDVARLVLHHRLVVEPCLVVRSGVQELRRHLHREDVRLVLLRDPRSARRRCRRAFFSADPRASGTGGRSLQGTSRTCHSARLARLVVAEDARAGVPRGRPPPTRPEAAPRSSRGELSAAAAAGRAQCSTATLSAAMRSASERFDTHDRDGTPRPRGEVIPGVAKAMVARVRAPDAEGPPGLRSSRLTIPNTPSRSASAGPDGREDNRELAAAPASRSPRGVESEARSETGGQRMGVHVRDPEHEDPGARQHRGRRAPRRWIEALSEPAARTPSTTIVPYTPPAMRSRGAGARCGRRRRARRFGQQGSCHGSP